MDPKTGVPLTKNDQIAKFFLAYPENRTLKDGEVAERFGAHPGAVRIVRKSLFKQLPAKDRGNLGSPRSQFRHKKSLASTTIQRPVKVSIQIQSTPIIDTQPHGSFLQALKIRSLHRLYPNKSREEIAQLIGQKKSVVSYAGQAPRKQGFEVPKRRRTKR